ncbi:MAG TPA: zf-TFIIB domain-containing protein [Candidatus Onthousia faecipullorum]|uniref:Zf-TFIIB domain-containing protein n=1 Tax=Candidatus Onthousia faecipullorum TaxID=2840887 RepID=A0A9D1GCQ8_9FIRM|nr:zf-TFIIB domain-containing protein [Candidatus Onthousia faecipullorum]
MKCPVCKDVTLLMSERRGVEIDYCPECRGIWLDRGELEKIMEKEDTYINKEIKESSHKESKHYEEKPKKHKRESFMSEIFEMFGE